MHKTVINRAHMFLLMKPQLAALTLRVSLAKGQGQGEGRGKPPSKGLHQHVHPIHE